MVYKLRNFENNYQVLASLGWFFVVMSVVLLFTKKVPTLILFATPGVLLILLQLRGKRVTVDTQNKTIKKGLKTIALNAPNRLFVNKVNLTQRVNSRASSTQAQHLFYKAFLQDGDEKIQISSNRKEERDMKTLKGIADELGIEFVLNY